MTRFEKASIVPNEVAVDLELFLSVLPGRAFCLHCLAEMLNIPLAAMQDAMKRLWCTSGVRVQAQPCDNCEQVAVTLQTGEAVAGVQSLESGPA